MAVRLDVNCGVAQLLFPKSRGTVVTIPKSMHAQWTFADPYDRTLGRRCDRVRGGDRCNSHFIPDYTIALRCQPDPLECGHSPHAVPVPRSPVLLPTRRLDDWGYPAGFAPSTTVHA